MAGGANSLKSRVRTPRGELKRLRDGQVGQELEVRERIMEAILRACGERGYREVSVQDVIDRYGGYRVQFYKHFANKAECYAAAYETGTERLCAAVLGASRAERDWRRRLRAALDELARFVVAEPDLARGLIVDVHVAGGVALVKRQEVFDRLCCAVDTARRETDSRPSPPTITAAFMVGAIEAAVSSALVAREPQQFSQAVPELAQIVDAAYFGDRAAHEEGAALRAV
jgi:AcrR family transcriptional regulator